MKIALIGSSGGNLYRQGGSEPIKMIQEIVTQCKSAGIECSDVVFVGADRSLDQVSRDTKASLYQMSDDQQLISSDLELLDLTNEAAIKADKKLAAKIISGNIDGLILLSADPVKTNEASVKAAAEKKIPLVGTGGTSVANVRKMGGNVVSASGTTGTTNRTRAIAFISALSKEFGLKYKPIIQTSSQSTEAQSVSVFQRINFRGIMMAAMPGFIAMALVLALSKIPAFSGLADVFNILIAALPVLIASIAAKQISGLDEVGIVAGLIAGTLTKDGGILGGMIVGILAGIMAYYISSYLFGKKVPGTTVNLAAGAISGLVAGFIGMYVLAHATLWAGNEIRSLINQAIAFSPLLAGLIAGIAIWPAIIGGVYHAAILPIVLLEMETQGYSFLGAIDMTGLVLVSAGITLANVLFPKEKGDRAAALPGFAINMGFGTFVEAAYPYMFSNKLVFAGAIVASGISGALVGILGVKGTAYVPTFLAPGLANEGKSLAFGLCMIVAMAISFVFTVIANKTMQTKNNK